MRSVLLATGVAAAAMLSSVPAHAAAMKIAIDQPCPAGYHEHVSVDEAGHTVKVCAIP